MATDKVVLDLEVNGDKAGKSLSDLKKEFKEAQKELSKLTQGSREYVEQLERLGAIRDDIGDLNQEINAFNPEGKIQALGKVVGGLAGGFAAAQGAVALFGVENEELEKTLVKIQAAMAFQQGIEGLAGLGDAFKVLWNIVKANPLGAIVTALALIGTGLTALYYSMDRTSESTKALNKELELQKDITLVLSKETERQVALLKSQGASELEVIAVKEKLTKQQILEIETSIKLHEAKLQDIRDNESLWESTLQVAAAIQSKLGNEQMANTMLAAIQINKQERAKEDLEAIATEREQVLDLKNQIAILANEKIAVNKKATESYLEDLAKEKTAQDKALADRKAFNEYMKNIDAEIAIQKEEDKAQAVLDEEADAANKINKNLADMKAAEELADYRIAQAEREKAAKEANINSQIDAYQQLGQATMAISDMVFAHQLRQAEGNSAKQREIAKRQFKVNKALGIVNSTIDGIQAVQKALNNPYPLNIILAVASGVAAAANVAKIASTQFNDGGGGVGASGGSSSVPSAPNVAPPSQGSTQLNSDGTIKAAQTTGVGAIKAYVVETDITKKQKQVGAIETNAKL